MIQNLIECHKINADFSNVSIHCASQRNNSVFLFKFRMRISVNLWNHFEHRIFPCESTRQCFESLSILFVHATQFWFHANLEKATEKWNWLGLVCVCVLKIIQLTSVNGSVSKLWTLRRSLEMVNANDQLCCIISIPTSPCLETFGWMIFVKNRTTGGCIGYLKMKNHWNINANL